MVDFGRYSKHMERDNHEAKVDSIYMGDTVIDEIPVAEVTVVDEDEFFNRYFGANYDAI